MPKKQTSPRRNATRKPSAGLARSTAIDLSPAPAQDELVLEALFDAETKLDELADGITRILMREVATESTALGAELALSELMGMAQLACPVEATWDERSESVDALVGSVTEIAERDASAPALALLRVIAVLAIPNVSDQAAQAARRLADAGVPDQPWVSSLGRPKVVRAWRYGDDFGYQESVSVMFDYAFREHVASVLIDHPLGGGVKDCWIAEGKRARGLRGSMAQEMAGKPATYFEDLGMGRTRDVLATALRSQPCPEQPDQIRDVAFYLPLVTARVALLEALAGES